MNYQEIWQFQDENVTNMSEEQCICFFIMEGIKSDSLLKLKYQPI